MKKLSILGSTGSIGRSTLDVVAKHPDRFKVVALAAGQDVECLAKQIALFRPSLVSVRDPRGATRLKEIIGKNDLNIVTGTQGACLVAALPDADLVVSAIVGSAGLAPTLAAIEAGKTIALANKETLVVAGQLVTELARKHGVTILPIDSEHSAIHQSLQGHRHEDVRQLLLTASGGPFRTSTMEELRHVTVAAALRHPNWSMGNKITVDSATLMNKGLEVIEATWLFGVEVGKVKVVVHPQSIIHSMVEFCDGSVLAECGVPDMRVPIAYAISYPERISSGALYLDVTKIGSLTFEDVDHKRFPCLQLAYDAIAEGGTMPAVLNAANEIAVAAFLQEQMSFLDIPWLVAKTMERHSAIPFRTLSDILEVDGWARSEAQTLLTSRNGS